MEKETIQEYANRISEAMMLAHLYGRSIIDSEMGASRAKYMKEDNITNIHFEEIPNSYEAALKYFLAKNIITRAEFDRLEKKLQKYSFTVAKISSKRLLAKIKESLDEALAEGIPMAEWLDQIDAVFSGAGMDALEDYHLKTVFRTNIQTALNEGKMVIIQEADIDEFPLIEFVAIEDDRVRGEHLRLDGFIAPKNDPIWQRLRPPLSYNCRCSIRAVHVSEGLKPSGRVPVISGKGFEFVS